jgi:dolichol-phosphate mannosyltransferase
MSRRIVDALLAMPERNLFLRGMTRWVGYEQTTVEYERAPRAAGASKYTVRKMFGFGWDAVISFSSVPLRIASVLGIVISFLGLIYLAYVIGIRLFTEQAVAGWTSVVAAVVVLVGIIGQYLGRMYDEIKGRPLFLIADDTSRRDVSAPTIESR